MLCATVLLSGWSRPLVGLEQTVHVDVVPTVDAAARFPQPSLAQETRFLGDPDAPDVVHARMKPDAMKRQVREGEADHCGDGLGHEPPARTVCPEPVADTRADGGVVEVIEADGTDDLARA